MWLLRFSIFNALRNSIRIYWLTPCHVSVSVSHIHPHQKKRGGEKSYRGTKRTHLVLTRTSLYPKIHIWAWQQQQLTRARQWRQLLTASSCFTPVGECPLPIFQKRKLKLEEVHQCAQLLSGETQVANPSLSDFKSLPLVMTLWLLVGFSLPSHSCFLLLKTHYFNMCRKWKKIQI